MHESMATKPIYIYIYIYIYADAADINMLTNACFFWLFVFQISYLHHRQGRINAQASRG